MFKTAAVVATLLAVFVYRSGRIAWNHVLTVPDLPDAYYVGGDWSSHCSLLQDPSSDDISSCEDITFWDHHDAQGALARRLVLLGCDPNRHAWNTVMGPLRDPDPRGHLFLYDPTADAVHRLTLEGYPPAHDFHPLGMAVDPSFDGAPSTLFVVNHARAHTTVEQFFLDPARPTVALYVRTLRAPYFVSPNALAMTSPTSFYVSNDHGMTRRLPGLVGRVAPLVETIAGLPLGWVAHVSVRADEDGDDGYVLDHAFAARGIAFANGIALSPSGTHLAIASTTLCVVHVYARAIDDGDTGTSSLTWSHDVPVPFFPDNVAYDDDGALIVAGHPHFPSLVAVAANATGARAPSWAVALSAGTYEVETLFQSDGSVFGSSSTTLRDARTGTLYVAGLYERGVLVCRPGRVLDRLATRQGDGEEG